MWVNQVEGGVYIDMIYMQLHEATPPSLHHAADTLSSLN